ncbi:MAG TPA: NAD(P)-dependent oxidoreductase, partial [Candidatus Limnocylindrales bacterium]
MFGKVDEHPPDWLDRLRTAPEMTVAVVGGSGRLGSWLTYFLASAGHRVRVVDTVAPLPAERVSFHRCDLLDGKALRNALAGCTQVCHLAALHGAHLVAGTSRSEIWNTNVLGTQHILEAATETNQVVLASSMSVYGSGTPAGMPARVLTDDTEPSPEDVYDLSKLAAERLMLRYGPRRSIALRFGRFFYPSQVDYQMRKLSTGVDVRDACQAIALALLAPAPPRPIYCVASDLPLPDPDRAQLGLDAVAVLRRHLPGLVEELDSRQLPIPARVG